MKIDLQSPDFEITKAIRDYVTDKTNRSLSSISGNLIGVTIHLRDVNGSRGGQDKECKVELSLADMPSIMVKKRSSDAYVAIKKAISRASRSGMRALRKRQSLRKYNWKKTAYQAVSFSWPSLIEDPQ